MSMPRLTVVATLVAAAVALTVGGVANGAAIHDGPSVVAVWVTGVSVVLRIEP